MGISDFTIARRDATLRDALRGDAKIAARAQRETELTILHPRDASKRFRVGTRVLGAARSGRGVAKFASCNGRVVPARIAHAAELRHAHTRTGEDTQANVIKSRAIARTRGK